MENLDIVVWLLIGIVVIVNVASYRLFTWLRELVLAAEDDYLGESTANVYAGYLYTGVMEGPFYNAPRMIISGNAENDKIVRTVKASDGYACIAKIARYLRRVPVNFIPYMIVR